ncbi:MAG TPA: hypothetical protein VF894_05905 [Anaeromyxobacter sp.]
MTEADRRLVALAAALAQDRAGPLLSRLATPGASDAVAHAQRLARSTRRERLQALAAALATDHRPARSLAEELAALERPRLARLLRSVAAGTPDAGGASPALLRLCRERIFG